MKFRTLDDYSASKAGFLGRVEQIIRPAVCPVLTLKAMQHHTGAH
jgi:hypothetical protein